MPFPFSYPTVCKTGGYNELIAPGGEIRPHWRTFFQTACRNGENKFPAYEEQAARLMSADIPAGGSGQSSATHGVIPFILSGDDFKTISAGLIQRAELFNRILGDLYGGQKLIMNGILPPQVIFSNPAYLPALKNIKPPAAFFYRNMPSIWNAPPTDGFGLSPIKRKRRKASAWRLKTGWFYRGSCPIFTPKPPLRAFSIFLKPCAATCSPARRNGTKPKFP